MKRAKERSRPRHNQPSRIGNRIALVLLLLTCLFLVLGVWRYGW